MTRVYRFEIHSSHKSLMPIQWIDVMGSDLESAIKNLRPRLVKQMEASDVTVDSARHWPFEVVNAEKVATIED